MHIPDTWKGIRPWTRHSQVLMVAGFVFIAIGFSYILAEPNPSRTVALQIALEWMPLDGWGWVFVTGGMLSIISSRYPPVSKTWGYMVLTGIAAGWSAFYVLPIIPLFGDSPATNISGGLLWGLFGYLWWAISGLLDPEVVKKKLNT